MFSTYEKEAAPGYLRFSSAYSPFFLNVQKQSVLLIDAWQKLL